MTQWACWYERQMTQWAFVTLDSDEGMMTQWWWKADDPVGMCYVVYSLREHDPMGMLVSLYEFQINCWILKESGRSWPVDCQREKMEYEYMV